MTGFDIIARPADDLAWAFFWLILGIFLVAIVLAFIARLRIRTEKSKDDLHDDMYIGSDSLGAIKEQLRPWQLAVALALPSVELVVGLLGTFIGICLAISGASDALSVGSGDTLTSAQQMARLGEQSSALQDMLGRIGLQFQTSIWGISANLLTRLAVYLVGEWSLSDKAKEVKHNLSESRQKEAEEAVRVRREELDYLKSMAVAARDAGPHRIAVCANFQELVQATQALRKEHSAANETLSTLTERIEALRKSQESRLQRISNDLVISRNGLATAMGQHSAELRTELEEVGVGMRRAVGEVGKDLSGHHASLLQENKRLSRVLIDDREAQAGRHLEIVTQLALQPQEVAEQGRRLDLRAASLLHRLGALEAAGKADAKCVVAAVGELRSRLESIPREIERLTSQIDKVAEAGDQMANAAVALDSSAQSLRGAAEDLKRSLAASVEELGATVQSVKEALEVTIRELRNGIAGQLKNLGASLEGHLSELDKSQQQTFAAVGQTLKELDRAVQSIAPHLEISLKQMERALAGVMDEVNQSLTKQLTLLRNAQAQSAKELRMSSTEGAERMRSVVTDVSGALSSLKETLDVRLGELKSSAGEMNELSSQNRIALTKLKNTLDDLVETTKSMNKAAEAASLRLDDLTGDANEGIGEQMMDIGQEIKRVGEHLKSLRSMTGDLRNAADRGVGKLDALAASVASARHG